MVIAIHTLDSVFIEVLMSPFKSLFPSYCRRKGAATVEFAVIAPVFVAILLGTIETCSVLFLRQTVKMAAHEAARASIVPDATQTQVENAAKTLLNVRSIKDYSITVTPAALASAAYGTLIRVEVRAPCKGNALMTSGFYLSKDVVGQVEMMKEY
jgi:Flp pilus assembly protein TadG